MNSKAIVSGAIILFAGNLLSAFLGLFREMLLAAQYGAGSDMDSYLFATTVPSILLTFVSSIFLTGFIPLFIKRRVHNSAEEASLMYSNTINWFIVIILLVIGLCYGLSGWLSTFFADNAQTHRMVEQLLWILIPGMLFFGLSYAQSAVLNSLNHFVTPALMTVINNIMVITFMVLFHEAWGIYSVAAGFVLGNVLQAAVQLPVLRMKGVRYKWYLSVKDEYLSKLVSLSLPIITLVLIDQMMVFSSRYFASYLDAGSASALNYANRIMLLPVTLFGSALVSATYPSAVQMLVENRQKDYNTIVTTGIKSLLLLLLPVFFICMMFATPIIQALFQRGAFDAKATEMTSSVFLVMSGCIVIMPIRDFFQKLFFSRGQLRTPIVYSLIYSTGFITACLLLVPRIGYLGIPCSMVSALLIAFSYFVYAYKRQNKQDAIGVSLSFLLKIAVSAAFSSIASYELFRFFLQTTEAGRVAEDAMMVLFIGFAMVLYVLTIKLWKIEEIDFVWAKLAAKLPVGRRGKKTAAESNA